MNIVLIEPKSPYFHIFSQFKLPRLGCVLLATIAERQGHRARVFVEEIAEIDWDIVAQADLVGISTTTSTAPRAYELAAQIRQLGIKVVIGGTHATFLPEQASRHADFVLTGEAENTFLELLEYLEGRCELSDVHNLVTGCDDAVNYGPVLSTRTDLTRLPIPDFSLIHDYTVARALLGRRRIFPVQVSRGCPYGCSFCSVTGMFGHRMRYRQIDSVIAELKHHQGRGRQIFFYDDNFAASPRRSKELLRAMKAERIKLPWTAQVRIEAAFDKELLTLMRETGCGTVYVGLESVNAECLMQAQKRQSVAEVESAMKLFHQAGIDVHGMFIFGFDPDGPETARETVRFARKVRLSSLQAMLLTPLPGSETYRDYDRAGRIISYDWSLYDSHHVVIRHPTLSTEQLQQLQMTAHSSFYSRSRTTIRALAFDFKNSAISIYARKLQKHWQKQNRQYLDSIRTA